LIRVVRCASTCAMLREQSRWPPTSPNSEGLFSAQRKGFGQGSGLPRASRRPFRSSGVADSIAPSLLYTVMRCTTREITLAHGRPAAVSRQIRGSFAPDSRQIHANPRDTRGRLTPSMRASARSHPSSTQGCRWARSA
jgi:hypothetical protein